MYIAELKKQHELLQQSGHQLNSSGTLVKPQRVSAAVLKATKQALKQRQLSEQQQKLVEYSNVIRSIRDEYHHRRDHFVLSNINVFAPFLTQSQYDKLVYSTKQPYIVSTAHMQQSPHSSNKLIQQHKLPVLQSYPPLNAEQIKQMQQPKIINATLRPYQLDSLRWFIGLHEYGCSGILADEMGLGMCTTGSYTTVMCIMLYRFIF